MIDAFLGVVVMYFSPKEYDSFKEMKEDSMMAVSDTVIDNRDVFGYVNGVPYFAGYVYDHISDATYAVLESE